MNGGVVHNVALLSDLYMNFELNCFSRQTFTKLVEEVVGVLGRGGGTLQMLDAGRRRNAVASKAVAKSPCTEKCGITDHKLLMGGGLFL
jgi:hypothetical protein